MNTVASTTTEFIMPSHVANLISENTRVQIGARRPVYGAERIQWTINRPPYVTDEGHCMVSVRPADGGGYIVTVARQEEYAFPELETYLTGIAAADVDAAVLRVCTAISRGEASRG